MLQHALYEVVGVVLVVMALVMLRVAKPVDGHPAAFLAKSEKLEIGYALIVLFLMAGGLASMILGFTT